MNLLLDQWSVLVITDVIFSIIICVILYFIFIRDKK
jgi:hypothetical protein